MYTLVDRQGIRQTSAPSYIAGLFWISAVLLTLSVRAQRTAWPWQLVAPGGWRALALSGVCSLSAYLLVLLALALSRVGYIAALRETSMLIAAWVGWRHLGDPHGIARFLSSAVIVAGLTLLIAFR
jgi:drug/metabolite transporter (DMT)-like permease